MSLSDTGTGKAPQSLSLSLVSGGEGGGGASPCNTRLYCLIATLHWSGLAWAGLDTHIVFTGMSDSCGYNQNDYTVSIWSISPPKLGHY